MTGCGTTDTGRTPASRHSNSFLSLLQPSHWLPLWRGGRGDQVTDSVNETVSATQSWSADSTKGGGGGGGGGGEQLSSDTSGMPVEIAGDVCRIEDSPFRILKVAASGNLKEFQRLYEADKSRLHLRDTRGQTVLHHAASKSKLNILEFIVKHDVDINVQDKNGNTPLHVAMERNQRRATAFLLDHDAKSDIWNLRGLAPIHLSIDLGHPEALEALLTSEKVDVNERDSDGLTALHYCSMTDDEKCVDVLLSHGADLLRKCNLGILPIHSAAKGGAHVVMDLILVNAHKLGVSAETLLAIPDREKKVPLHAAVNSGSIKVVEVCLKYGASIESQQDDLSTPVHGAVSQGRLDMVRSMLEGRPDAISRVLKAKDIVEMTPLHTAALFDQAKIAEYLIEKGADIDSQDKESRTPLLLAASKQAWTTVKLLLSNKADMTIRDHRNRNFLHLAIIHSAKLQDFGESLFKEASKLLNERDDFGCTPMHYASREGHLSAIEDLLTLGAFLNIKNNDKQSPLHFAARYGRLNTCIRLLNSSEGPHIINETDGDGLTALHMAAQNGHVKVVQCLLQKGAALHRDNAGNTPLHLAAAGYTQTMKLPLSVHGHILNAKNMKGESALHIAAKVGHVMAVTLLMSMNADFTLDNDGFHFLDYAIQGGHKDVASAIISHERWREAMELRSHVSAPPMIELVKHLPEVSLAVLDRCQISSSSNGKSDDIYYHYDFRYLQNVTSAERKGRNSEGDATPMHALNMMVEFNRVECLSHPVCVNFLKMKWRAYGFWINMANLGIYVTFLGVLTTYVIILNPGSTDMTTLHTASPFEASTVDSTTEVVITETTSVFLKVAFSIIAGFCGLNMIKELIQMVQQRERYFLDFNNALEWLLYITSSVFVVPTAFGKMEHYQWECGAVAVFVAWFIFLLYLQRFDFFGIYVVMFLEILKTLFRVITVFSILIIAFGLAFYILLRKEDTAAHRTPLLSMMRTFIMMLGEIDYIPIFIDPQADNAAKPLIFGSLPFIFLIIFVLLMPILLMNLLIGLAVGDIEAVQRNARLKRLAMQVELHTDLERKLPRRILKLVDKAELKSSQGNRKNPFSWIMARFFRARDHEHDLRGRCDVYSAEYSALHNEIQKQKRRMKELAGNMEKQHELLRLIVQKMEIHSEAEERDVGDNNTQGVLSNNAKGPSVRNVGWTSPLLRSVVPKKASVVRKWSRTVSEGAEPSS